MVVAAPEEEAAGAAAEDVSERNDNDDQLHKKVFRKIISKSPQKAFDVFII